jgi:hypothetical protein
MRQALSERRKLIEARASTILDTALDAAEPWTAVLGAEPNDQPTATAWRNAARTVAAYRDRYQITSPHPLGAPPETDAQKIDAARAQAAGERARQLATDTSRQPEPPRRAQPERSGPRL